ncbi:hypothetical protein NUU61_009835 [Penicillium alfredii]|uniref:Fe2OG dioxygenase domain-containing protein n=1 Tax=Penicillium alfredii TaxID=1506179 RepID=A0A9W9JU29_9EURO|nr:uncharacterized protein NUU61_009835 [Penicillium alfredii]KAJ5081571.1 hypothetical protein NUU61_009835 [Penicillium alfredii]
MAAAVMLPPAPPKVVGPTTKKATRPTNKLPQFLIDEALVGGKEVFDPTKHLNFQPPENVYTMKQIGLEGHGISPVAASEPFPLFTTEAIKQIRAEIFSEPVLEHCQYASTFAKNMVRGMGRARAPFTYDAWTCPDLLTKLSKVAGIDLALALDFEIANINISINEQTTTIMQSEGTPVENDPPAFAWHYDSFPFVCVTMLSDCTGMVGGETAIRTPSGEILKIRGPAMGTAVVMQGRYIEHQALKAMGGRERISMVTAFRAKSPLIRDETVLTGSRPISNWSELYTQYTEYRLELLEERIRTKLKAEKHRDLAKRPFNIPDMQRFLNEQKLFLEDMVSELIEVEDMD